MKKTYCDSCGREIERVKGHTIGYNDISIYYNNDGNPDEYELCDACFEAMKREIPKLLNWRNRLS